MLDRSKAYINESRGRDDYGRPVLTVNVYHPDLKGVYVTGVVVTMPKTYREVRPNEKYLVNDWSKGAGKGVTYWANRNAAIAYLKDELFKELERV